MQFVCAMLLNTGTITKDDIRVAAQQFDALDHDRSGSLSMIDIMIQEEAISPDHHRQRHIHNHHTASLLAWMHGHC